MNQHEYDRSIISVYDVELSAIAAILTELGMPIQDDNGGSIPDRLRVRVLADEVLELRAAKTDLLAALMSIDELLSHPGNTQTATVAMVRRMASDAIAKAEGNTAQ